QSVAHVLNHTIGGLTMSNLRIIAGILVITSSALAVPTTTRPSRDWSRPPVSADERESMELDPCESGEIVHPDVYVALDERKVGAAVRWLSGRAYVQVKLRIDASTGTDADARRAAIKSKQETLLSRLTAAEFAVKLRFAAHPAILGYATQSGLA